MIYSVLTQYDLPINEHVEIQLCRMLALSMQKPLMEYRNGQVAIHPRIYVLASPSRVITAVRFDYIQHRLPVDCSMPWEQGICITHNQIKITSQSSCIAA